MTTVPWGATPIDGNLQKNLKFATIRLNLLLRPVDTTARRRVAEGGVAMARGWRERTLAAMSVLGFGLSATHAGDHPSAQSHVMPTPQGAAWESGRYGSGAGLSPYAGGAGVPQSPYPGGGASGQLMPDTGAPAAPGLPPLPEGAATTPTGEAAPTPPGATAPTGAPPTDLAAAIGAGAEAAPATGAGLGGLLGGGGAGLNMIGDQGVIVIGPRFANESPVSIVRAFALNITDNNTATLQNRIIPLEYYRFWGANRVYPGLPSNPDRFADLVIPSSQSFTRLRTDDSRYVFGLEAILAPRWSVVVRQAVVTIKPPTELMQHGLELHPLNGTVGNWSDLQISPKYLISSNDRSILTAGLGTIIPVGARSAYTQTGSGLFVLQPNILFFTRPAERWFFQGAVEYDVPIAKNIGQASLMRWTVAPAYLAYNNPDGRILNQIFPIIEFHGAHLLGDFPQTTVNFTAGVRFNVLRRAQVGIGYATPLTEQTQFWNELLFNMSIFF
jgi:hypothetical protein